MATQPQCETPPVEIRRAGADGAAEAVAILREVSEHFARRGHLVWTRNELREADFVTAAEAGELILGYAGGHPAATMLLQTADRKYWPEAASGTALYVHKVGVRRAFAGCGWLKRLIDFAVDDARSHGLGRLRLDTLPGPALPSLYEDLGFIALDEPPYRAAGRTVIRMERLL